MPFKVQGQTFQSLQQYQNNHGGDLLGRIGKDGMVELYSSKEAAGKADGKADSLTHWEKQQLAALALRTCLIESFGAKVGESLFESTKGDLLTEGAVLNKDLLAAVASAAEKNKSIEISAPVPQPPPASLSDDQLARLQEAAARGGSAAVPNPLPSHSDKSAESSKPAEDPPAQSRKPANSDLRREEASVLDAFEEIDLCIVDVDPQSEAAADTSAKDALRREANRQAGEAYLNSNPLDTLLPQGSTPKQEERRNAVLSLVLSGRNAKAYGLSAEGAKESVLKAFEDFGGDLTNATKFGPNFRKSMATLALMKYLFPELPAAAPSDPSD